MAYLQSISGSDYGKQYPLESGTVVLGRHPNCDVVLEASAVSRYHAHHLETLIRIRELQEAGVPLANIAARLNGPALKGGDNVGCCFVWFLRRVSCR